MRNKAKHDMAYRLARIGYEAHEIVVMTKLKMVDVLEILNADRGSLSPILPQDVRSICSDLIENVRELCLDAIVRDAVIQIINIRIPRMVHAWNESLRC